MSTSNDIVASPADKARDSDDDEDEEDEGDDNEEEEEEEDEEGEEEEEEVEPDEEEDEWESENAGENISSELPELFCEDYLLGVCFDPQCPRPHLRDEGVAALRQAFGEHLEDYYAQIKRS